ncbi:MAG TPA: hypothetical protein VF692_15540 [Pyrinomonadaceae bacterium]|jgi:hypothetical protein
MKKNIFAMALMSILTLFVSAQDKTAELVKVEDGQSYLVLSTKKIGTMEKELDQAAKGFRVLYGAPTQQFDMALFLQKLAPGETPYNYKIMATIRNKTMEKELNEFAAQGYRLLPRTVVFKQGFLTAEMVMLMERAPNSGKAYEYKLIAASKETKLHSKIDDAVAEGFTPLTMITIGNHIIVMEKETAIKQ